MLANEWLKARGMRKPIWINESNVVPYNDPVQPIPPGNTRATLDEQASYVIQSYAMGIAANVERQAIYKMVDEEAENGQFYGLVRNNGSTRPAYTAYQVAAKYFTGVRSAFYTWPGLPGPARENDIWPILESANNRVQFIWPAQVSHVVMERGDRRTSVLWNNSPVEVETSFEAASTSAALITKYGQTFPVTPRSGRYYVTLQGSANNSDLRDTSIYLVGGDPVIIDELVQPLPTRVLARIESVEAADGKPLHEMNNANVTAVLSLPGTNDPPPCRWNPEVQLWGRTVARGSVLLGTAMRKFVTEQGRTYPIWEFRNVDVSANTDPEGKRLVAVQVRLNGVQTDGDAWVLPAPPPTPRPAAPGVAASPTPVPPTPTPTPASRIVLSKSCES
jgi:hypothetical protein